MTDSILKDYFQTIQVAPSTEKLYRYHFKNYEKATEYTLKELLEEAEDEESRDIKPRNRKIKHHIQQYKEYLNEKGYSPGHIKIALTFISKYQIQDPKPPFSMPVRTRQTTTHSFRHT